MNYTSEKNILILISLLKAYGIKKVVASPGGTNLSFVASIQNDPFFEIYSCVDERSAGYMACGLAGETLEPVVISCTGATAARNYMPALTEAYYRKLPVVAITSSRNTQHVGHLYAQMTDRSNRPNDIVINSECIQQIRITDDEWDCIIKINKVLSSLFRHGGGPVHLNVETKVSRDYSITELPKIRKIDRYFKGDKLPAITANRIAVFVGSHHRWTQEETDALDSFCASYNAAVYCDHSSNFKGKNRILTSIIGMQNLPTKRMLDVDLAIHIGEVSGGYEAHRFSRKQTWRVNPDGEMRDLFHTLSAVFEMNEIDFFKYYGVKEPSQSQFSKELFSYYNEIIHKIPTLPFSNLWVAQQLSHRLPEGAVLHLGILNSLRAWNCFEIPMSVNSYSNTGGFGIDGPVSTLLGASYANINRLYFLCVGDLAFFYDLNSLGNRHIKSNVRILLINNGHGQEFLNNSSPGAELGDLTDKYIAAGGHFGNKSQILVKHYAEDLGFKYISARTKEEFNTVMSAFLDSGSGLPIIFEIFTDSIDESKALEIVSEIDYDKSKSCVRTIKKIAKSIIKK